MWPLIAAAALGCIFGLAICFALMHGEVRDMDEVIKYMKKEQDRLLDRCSRLNSDLYKKRCQVRELRGPEDGKARQEPREVVGGAEGEVSIP